MEREQLEELENCYAVDDVTCRECGWSEYSSWTCHIRYNTECKYILEKYDLVFDGENEEIIWTNKETGVTGKILF